MLNGIVEKRKEMAKFLSKKSSDRQKTWNSKTKIQTKRGIKLKQIRSELKEKTIWVFQIK